MLCRGCTTYLLNFFWGEEEGEAENEGEEEGLDEGEEEGEEEGEYLPDRCWLYLPPPPEPDRGLDEFVGIDILVVAVRAAWVSNTLLLSFSCCGLCADLLNVNVAHSLL